LTDQDNYILDTGFAPLADPGPLAAQLDGRAGIVEHGLFIGLVHDVIVASAEGVRHLVCEQ
jgi:ribose 5-phosphate isomerase A